LWNLLLLSVAAAITISALRSMTMPLPVALREFLHTVFCKTSKNCTTDSPKNAVANLIATESTRKASSYRPSDATFAFLPFTGSSIAVLLPRLTLTILLSILVVAVALGCTISLLTI